MRGVLVRIDCRHYDGRELPLLLASVDSSDLCHLGGEQWEPSLARLPVLRYDFFGGDFRGQIVAPRAQFVVAIDAIDQFFARIFANARVRVWSGTVGEAFSSFRLRFDGIVAGEPEIQRGIANFEASTDDRWLDGPLLGTFAGTGGIEGPEDIEGTVKPLALGNSRFCHGELIDPVDLVYMINNGPVVGTTAVYDRVNSLGASVGDYGNLPSLLAAGIPEGRWGTCNVQGLVRLGAPPDGRVAFDVSGDNRGGIFARMPGQLIGRIAQIAGGTTVPANLAKLDEARPYNLQIDLFSQTSARDVIQEIADSVGAVAGITWTGELFVQPLGIEASPTVSLAADGTSELPVAEVSTQQIGAPYWRLATRAQPTWVVYDVGEAATDLTIRGEYSAEREYRYGDLVYTADGSSFSYIAEASSTGNAPVDGSAFWKRESTGAESARFISLTASHLIFPYDSTGAPKPQTASYVASKQNVTDAIFWKVSEVDGTVVAQGTKAAAIATGYFSDGGGDTLTQTHTQFAAFLTERVTSGMLLEAYSAGDSTIQGRISVAKVQDGPQGAPGAPGEVGPPGPAGSSSAALAPGLTKESARVSAYADGTVVSYAPANSQFVVRNGTADVSADFTLSVTSNPQALTVAITQASKAFNVTAGLDASEDSATLTMRMTGSGAYAGITLDKVFSIEKLKGGYEIVSALPSANLFEGRIAFNSTDDKLYIYRNGQWKPQVDVDTAITNLAPGVVTPRHMAVGMFSSNLVSNPRAIYGTDEWYKPPELAGTLTAGPSSEGHNFTLSKNLVGELTAAISRKFPVVAGKTYLARAKVWGSSGTTSGLYMRLGFAAEEPAGDYVPLANATVPGVENAPVSLYTPTEVREFTVQVPAGMNWASFVIYNWGEGPLALAFTNAEVRDQIDAALIVDGGVVARHIGAEQVTTSKLAVGAVTAAKANITQLSSLTGDFGTMTAGILRSPDGRAEFDLDNGRIVFNNGSYMRVLGRGFGTTGQFIDWFGPSLSSTNLCAENNAVFFLKTTGQAYFAGDVDSGVVVNTNRTDSSLVGAEVILGPFNTNGFQKETTFSFGYSVWYQHWDVESYTLSTSGQAQCERSVNGGAWQNVGTLFASGNIVKTPATGNPQAGGGPGEYSATLNGTLQIADNTGPTANLRYRMAVTANSHNLNGGISITCKE